MNQNSTGVFSRTRAMLESTLESTLDGVAGLEEDLKLKYRQLNWMGRRRLGGEPGADNAVSRMREEFLTVASHELRTPLTALKLQMELMLRMTQRGPLPVPAQEDLLRRLKLAERQVNRIQGLTENLLQAARIRSGSLDLAPEPTVVSDLIQDSITRFREGAGLHPLPIEIGLEGSGTGYWDRDKLIQVIHHLLGNAATFGQGKPVRIRAICQKGRVRIVVQDHGMGIPKETQAKLFRMFHRGVPSESFGGFGLGLYIVNQIVQAHGGRVRVQSKPGIGSRFILELPLMPERLREAATRAGSQRMAG